MRTFTPAPWRICEHNWSDTSIYGEDDFRVASLSIEDEATEETQSDLEGIMASNARLISAAPDMYEALKATKQMLDSFAEFGSVDGEVYDAAESVVRKALSKADGREG